MHGISHVKTSLFCVPGQSSFRGISRPIKLPCAQEHEHRDILHCRLPTQEHSHCSLRDGHVQITQDVVRVLLRAILLEGVTYADRLLASCLQGSS